MNISKSIIWSSVVQFGITGIQLISTLILARLLTPYDFGLLAPISIFISISTIIVDSGMGGYLVKKNTSSINDYSTLLAFNIISSLLLFFIAFIISKPVSKFYGIDELVQIIRIYSITIVINGIGIIFYIKLLKELKFKALAKVNIISGITSLVIAILMAELNYGVWTIVFQQISFQLLSLLLLIYYSKLFPRFYFSLTLFREQFKFGIHLLMANVLKSLSDNAVPVFLAKTTTLSQTGNFVQASKLVSYNEGIITGIIDKALFPVFSRIESTIKLRSLFTDILLIATIFSIPFSILIAILSDQIVAILLGNQWHDAVWMLKILSLSLTPIFLQIICRTILKSMGKTNYIFFNEAIKSGALILLLSFAYFLNFKLMIWSIVISQIISFFSILFKVSISLNVKILDRILELLTTSLFALISYLISYYVIFDLIAPNSLANLLSAIFFVSIYFIIIFLFYKARVINAFKNISR